MRSLTADEIATLLNRLGLPSSKFDTEEIAKDLKERTVQNETLSADFDIYRNRVDLF